jgi:hypothetical protein
MGSNSERAPAAYRLATWLLPPHRKQWAEAMLNETAYIKSRGAALQWFLGCSLTALRERVAYELERSMVRTLLKLSLGLIAVLVVGAVGIYIDAKPYQRDRIWIAMRGTAHSGQRKEPRNGNGAPASERPDNGVRRP